MLGLAIANYIHVLDPTRILVSCEFPEMIGLIEPAFQASLEANTVPVMRGSTLVQFRPTIAASFAKGAAARVLEQLHTGYQRNPSGTGEPDLATP